MSNLFNFEKLRAERSARILSIYKETDNLIKSQTKVEKVEPEKVEEVKIEKSQDEIDLEKAYETLGLNITDNKI